MLDRFPLPRPPKQVLYPLEKAGFVALVRRMKEAGRGAKSFPASQPKRCKRKFSRRCSNKWKRKPLSGLVNDIPHISCAREFARCGPAFPGNFIPGLLLPEKLRDAAGREIIPASRNQARLAGPV